VIPDDYITDLIKREGGYTNHPADRGGPTCWGITEQVARAYGYIGEIEAMPQSVARTIYLDKYWIWPRFDQVNEICTAVAEELLDTGVNMGQGMAATFLQRALNVLNREGKLYPDIKVDGGIGKMTLAALNAYLKARGKDGETVILRALNAQQGERYIQLAEKRPSQEEFIHGWFLNRVA
jgi:lysozyme family protein